MMRNMILAAVMAALLVPAPVAAQWSDRDKRERQDRRRADKEYRRDVREARKDYRRETREARQDWREARNYDWDRPDRRYGNYRPERYYRDGRYYAQARYLGRNDRIYRGGNGRYYCRRDDGTTGLIVGALGGGVLGNVIAPGGSETLGTLLGAGLGAALGTAIDRNEVRCR